MIPFQNPGIELFGLKVEEPITAFTDLLVALVAFIGYIKTASDNNEKHVSYYRYFFLLTGISTFVSAIIGHAFNYVFGNDARMIGWLFGILGVAFAQFAVLYNTKEIIGDWFFPKLLILNYLEVTVILILMFMKRSFILVEVHSAFGLVFMVTVLEAINYSRTRSSLSKNMIYGVALAVAAVVCHITKLAFSRWFNHIDLSHLFMAFSLYIMYKGVSIEQKKNKSIIT